ncbi:hypothetical protein A3C91_01335 [Candidatus Azambacteria bacterium RIFCSPHIGHO2_02_FULL_52_12]|uniref:Bifunctional protein FolD n=1 Tax=Candidatus Azambacteria bacterium RIFCSPLOWO2_01_FULL_46_25 TaxID=1797298 RepID=A0A1F5BVB2_9BACT|nr:MAG: hypothetical protein A3C91_01335 [Candidatus Azambacteria bacterium RIFCSPHIGHO2_02_FULL_52_12]OGD34531.1 MAG: hypothetical protein A2988_03395 [Candidatus Azambacteria bacterium RIFCSPLOWO2_01_FULL_46_25]OGD36405.1 MAG: hypothetical protein A2850_01895 [Candidatus Azambacteria bacterium RIFCSPHIGHO2_01_FULL_51_74]
MLLLYGKPLAQKVERDIARHILRQSRGQAGKMRRKPALAVVLAGDNHASVNYVERKGLAARSVGCGFAVHRLPAGVSQARVALLIEKLNKSKLVDGIIVQLPMPTKFNTQKILSAIAPQKDVDNLRGDSPYLSPSVQAIWHMLSKAGKPQKHTSILIVGHGRLIGKPVYGFLLKKGFTNITVADKTTKNLSTLTAKADVIISAVGKPGLIKKVKKGAIVIDAGSGLKKGKIKGDVDVARVAQLAKIVTPVPGGVGPLTVVYLFKNLLSAFLK